MIDPKQIQALGEKITAQLPPFMGEAKKNTQALVHQVLQGFFSELNLMTREEFELQRKVLEQTRHRVEALEKQLATLTKK